MSVLLRAADQPTRRPAPRAVAEPAILPLENGDRLRSEEFLRRWEAMPDLKKAELVQNLVLMPSPVSAVHHAGPDSTVQMWLAAYAARASGCETFTNTTLLLDSDNTYQPDVVLCTTPRRGRRVWFNRKGYLCGAPELVCEIAASTVSLDLHEKLDVYRRQGVEEYLVWRTRERGFDWFVREHEEFRPVRPDAQGRIESRTFPGLVLDVRALLARRSAKVLEVLLAATATGGKKKGLRR